MKTDLKTLIILFKAHQSILNQVKLSLEQTQLSVNEFAAMEALSNKGTLTTSEIRDYVLVPNSSMTYVLDTLEKKELIKRERSAQDRRIQHITLSEKGKDLFSEVYETHFTHMRAVFEILDPQEEQQLQELLKKLGKSTY